MLFNEKGFIDIDEMISQEPSFQTIMEDGIVTADELSKQSELVVSLLHEAENRFSEDDQKFIKKLLAETNVLNTVYRYYELQNLS
jgi:hypothetical protein